MHIPGACRSATNCAPPPPPSLPLGKFERDRFYEKGYRGMNEAHFAGAEFLPFGGYVEPESISVNLKLGEARRQSERHGFHLHDDDVIYKEVNRTVIVNGTTTFNITVEKATPKTQREIKLGIAR